VFIRSARNVLSVTALPGGRCRIEAEGRVTLPWWLVPLAPVATLALRTAARGFFRDLEHRLEHGVPHPDVVSARA
jgi:hypothetical protein